MSRTVGLLDRIWPGQNCPTVCTAQKIREGRKKGGIARRRGCLERTEKERWEGRKKGRKKRGRRVGGKHGRKKRVNECRM